MLQSSEIFCWDVESTAQPGAELQALGFHLLNWVLGNTSCPDTPCVIYQSTILIRGEQKYWISKSCEIEIKNGLYNIHFILSSEVIFFYCEPAVPLSHLKFNPPPHRIITRTILQGIIFTEVKKYGNESY